MQALATALARGAKSSSSVLAPSVTGLSSSQATLSSSSSSSSATGLGGVAPPSNPPHPSEAFLTGANAVVLEDMFEKWRADPSSVHPSWSNYFANVEAEIPPGSAFSWTRDQSAAALSGAQPTDESVPYTAYNEAALEDSHNTMLLIRSYRVHGHLNAKLDPLDLEARVPYAELRPELIGLENLNKTVYVGNELPGDRPFRTIGEVVETLNAAYCGPIGVEYMHIQNPEQKAWIRARVEKAQPYSFSPEERKSFYNTLIKATLFEQTLATKHAAAKRFGVEGCETMVLAMDQVIESAAEKYGVEYVSIGMPHRGRLNVLANVMGKDYRAIFKDFSPHASHNDAVLGSGDVKYHFGASSKREYPGGKSVDLSLASNPSHLEAVGPVVIGKTRAHQYYNKDHERKKSMSVVVHGDAAFAGQGVVAETLELSMLPNYRTGGTIHIVANNQVGFTTNPEDGRSSRYCTDLAKSIQVPIFHVNGDDPDAVAHVAQLAVEWRQTWHTDVVIDVIGYRRHGHNEMDEPMFTQPIMYAKIKKHPTVLKQYRERLVKDKIITAAEAKTMERAFQEHLTQSHAAAPEYVAKKQEWLESPWAGYAQLFGQGYVEDTAVSIDRLKEIGKHLTTIPDGFSAHRQMVKQKKALAEAFEKGEGLMWAAGEALAFGSLVQEGVPVRLSGQDSIRGTFSQRHAAMFDQKTGQKYFSLSPLDSENASFDVMNSPLSEFAVLGFELGYSLSHPLSLTLWEAQFGDFANSAQVIIDQFLSAGEQKWDRKSGLVMLLPHGYEGQGPEHSSARLERYLQLCDQDPRPQASFEDLPDSNQAIINSNMIVVYPSTPASYFHALRRQVRASFRKPLIVMTPKALLKFAPATSKLEDFGPGSRFDWVIEDESPNLVQDSKMRKVVFCSGKVYYDIVAGREKQGVDDVAVVRVEQLSPFPFRRVRDVMNKYANADIVWAQEEPMNMGSWSHVEPRMETCAGSDRRPKYVGRAPSASTATGYADTHKMEQDNIVKEALE